MSPVTMVHWFLEMKHPEELENAHLAYQCNQNKKGYERIRKVTRPTTTTTTTTTTTKTKTKFWSIGPS